MSIHFYAGYWQFGVGVTNFEGCCLLPNCFVFLSNPML